MHRFASALLGGLLLLGLQAPAFTAAADNADILEAECQTQLNLGDAGCACIGDQAEDMLNDKQQELVVAMVTKNQAAADAVRGEMTMDEITGAANFMMSAPQLCAGQ